MHITLTSIRIEATDAIQTYALEKMKTLEKYIPREDTSAKLALELSKTTAHHAHGEVFQAEAQLHIKGKEITLRATEDDLYKAIDTLKDMLARELATHKDRERSVFRKSAHKVKLLFKKLTD
jgi:ribosomal subunit interface protein